MTPTPNDTALTHRVLPSLFVTRCDNLAIIDASIDYWYGFCSFYPYFIRLLTVELTIWIFFIRMCLATNMAGIISPILRLCSNAA